MSVHDIWTEHGVERDSVDDNQTAEHLQQVEYTPVVTGDILSDPPKDNNQNQDLNDPGEGHELVVQVEVATDAESDPLYPLACGNMEDDS